MHEAREALYNSVCFIDDTVIGIARSGDYEAQNLAHNGHKRKHALKYKAVTAPGGLILQAHGPLKGHQHDWMLHMRSESDDALPQMLFIEGRQYVIYGD